MRFFFDTEFIEGFHKPWFGKRRHFIDLISIGIVDDNGSEFYAICSEYDYADADEWVRENVILPLYRKTVSGDARNHFTVSNFHKHFGRTKKEIMCDIMLWIYRDTYQHWLGSTEEFLYRGLKFGWGADLSHEFYAYYADYDWVLFCSLFGRMIDLPFGFPMYCRDLKQILDEKVEAYDDRLLSGNESFEWKLQAIKNKAHYPKQENEHDALDDAKWNRELFKFNNSL